MGIGTNQITMMLTKKTTWIFISLTSQWHNTCDHSQKQFRGSIGLLLRSWHSSNLTLRSWVETKTPVILSDFDRTRGPEDQKPKTFRIAAFYAQNFSGRSARIHFLRNIKNVILSHNISKKRVTLSRDIKQARYPHSVQTVLKASGQYWNHPNRIETVWTELKLSGQN